MQNKIIRMASAWLSGADESLGRSKLGADRNALSRRKQWFESPSGRQVICSVLCGQSLNDTFV